MTASRKMKKKMLVATSAKSKISDTGALGDEVPLADRNVVADINIADHQCLRDDPSTAKPS